MAKLEIEVGTPKVVETHYAYFPFMFRLGNGDLLLKAYCGSDGSLPEEQYRVIYAEPEGKTISSDEMLKEDLARKDDTTVSNEVMNWSARSHDNGQTWVRCGAPMGDKLGELRDGTLIIFMTWVKKRNNQKVMMTYRSTDQGKTWTIHYCPIHMPASVKKDGDYWVFLYRKPIELDDGSILVSAYTNFDQPGVKRRRIIVFRSVDKGMSFDYYGTVACNYNVEAGGFTEPVLQKLANGDILCVMRTASGFPSYQCRSTTMGATWSEPEQTGFTGVDPDLCLMENGVLACSYGRPGSWVAFSADGAGRLWTNRTCIWDTFGGGGFYKKGFYKSERNCGYTSICGIGPGKVLMALSAPLHVEDQGIITPWDPEQLKGFFIWTVPIDVKMV